MSVKMFTVTYGGQRIGVPAFDKGQARRIVRNIVDGQCKPELRAKAKRATVPSNLSQWLKDKRARECELSTFGEYDQ